MGENSRIQSTSIEGSLFLYCIPKLLRFSYGQIALSYAKLRSGFHASVNCYLSAPPKVKKKGENKKGAIVRWQGSGSGTVSWMATFIYERHVNCYIQLRVVCSSVSAPT